MVYEQPRPRHGYSAIRRARLLCVLLALPGFIAIGVLFFSEKLSSASAILLALGLLIYLALVSAALLEELVRPLQTLSNVVASLREGDYSFRARRAGSETRWGNWRRRSTRWPICCSGSACARSKPPRCWRASWR